MISECAHWVRADVVCMLGEAAAGGKGLSSLSILSRPSTVGRWMGLLVTGWDVRSGRDAVYIQLRVLF